MPRQKSLFTVIRDLVQQEVRSAMLTDVAVAGVGVVLASAGIEEQGGIDGERRRTLDAVGDPHPEGASPSPQAVLRDARHRTHALRGGGD